VQNLLKQIKQCENEMEMEGQKVRNSRERKELLWVELSHILGYICENVDTSKVIIINIFEIA
jgi:hypothetical protein